MLPNAGGLVPWRSLGHLLTRSLPGALSITDNITCLVCCTHSFFHDDPSQIPNLMIHPGVLWVPNTVYLKQLLATRSVTKVSLSGFLDLQLHWYSSRPAGSSIVTVTIS